MMSSHRVHHLYQRPALSSAVLEKKLKELKAVCPLVSSIESEFCINIEARGRFLSC